MNQGNIKREKFYTDSRLFFEEGLLKELYSSENLCICNIANQCYGAFPYLDTEDGQACLLITAQEVRLLINDEMFFSQMISSLDKKSLADRSIALNSRIFELMKKMKSKNDINGPTADIDLQMEQELLSIKKSK